MLPQLWIKPSINISVVLKHICQCLGPLEKRTSPLRPCARIAEGLVEMVAYTHRTAGPYGPDVYEMIELLTSIDMRNEQEVAELVCDVVELGMSEFCILTRLLYNYYKKIL